MEVVLGPVQLDAFDYAVLENRPNHLIQPIWRRSSTLEMSNNDSLLLTAGDRRSYPYLAHSAEVNSRHQVHQLSNPIGGDALWSPEAHDRQGAHPSLQEARGRRSRRHQASLCVLDRLWEGGRTTAYVRSCEEPFAS